MTTCFMVTNTGRVRLALRRFTFSGRGRDCPSSDFGHDASVDLGDALQRVNEDGSPAAIDAIEYAGHPAWPTTCAACGEPFIDTDQWQVRQTPIYASAEGQEWPLREVPVGAMWDAEWYPRKGPDGKALCVALPPEGGDDYWYIDGPSSDGQFWTRTGEPPRITVKPSILTPRYHGFLTDGLLEP